MKYRTTLSFKIYVFLIIVLTLLAAISPYLPQGFALSAISDKQLPAPRWVISLTSALSMLLIYGGLGYVGWRLSYRLNFANIWDEKVSNRQRFLLPAFTGAAIGILFIAIDQVLSNFHEMGPLPHPPFPTSLVASLSAGIGEEVIFRLFFISFWVWLISHVILKEKSEKQVFWIVVFFSALAFAAAHMPSVMMLYGVSSLSALAAALLGEIILLNGILSVVAAYHFRYYGLLAAIGTHFWTDVIWHVIWGGLG